MKLMLQILVLLAASFFLRPLLAENVKQPASENVEQRAEHQTATSNDAPPPKESEPEKKAKAKERKLPRRDLKKELRDLFRTEERRY